MRGLTVCESGAERSGGDNGLTWGRCNFRLGNMLGTESSAVASPGPCGVAAREALSWKEIVASVEPFLESVGRELMRQVDTFDPAIASYADYALTGQGKQLRPALVALSAGATGKVQEAHVRVAVIIEMVHLATLVHDDVIDEADLRRGRPTMAAHWGNEISVLLGDCLFAQALRLAASFPTPDICRAVAASTNTVCSGEILQVRWRKNFSFSQTEYFKILRMKTGELFGLSCGLGAFLSGAGGRQRNALRQYGLAVGTAYQVFDDCVDLFGSERVAGKSLGTDLAKGKLTLPILIMLERMEPGDRAKMEQILGEWRPEHLGELRKQLQIYDTLEGSRAAVYQYLELARKALEMLPETESRSALLELTDYLARQTAAFVQVV